MLRIPQEPPLNWAEGKVSRNRRRLQSFCLGRQQLLLLREFPGRADVKPGRARRGRGRLASSGGSGGGSSVNQADFPPARPVLSSKPPAGVSAAFVEAERWRGADEPGQGAAGLRLPGGGLEGGAGRLQCGRSPLQPS